MKQYVILTDGSDNSTYGIVVKDGMAFSAYGAHRRAEEWASWANSQEYKSLEQLLPPGVIQSTPSALHNDNHIFIKGLLDVAISGASFTPGKRSYVESHRTNAWSATPSARDFQLRAFGVDGRQNAVSFKALAFKSDSGSYSFAALLRSGTIGFNPQTGLVRSRIDGTSSRHMQAKVDAAVPRGIQRLVGMNDIAHKSLVKNRDITGGQIEFKKLGQRLGSRLGGGLRAAPTGLVFIDVTGRIDADKDGIVFESTPLERPIIPRFTVPEKLGRKISSLLEGSSEENEKLRKAGRLTDGDVSAVSEQIQALLGDEASTLERFMPSGAVASRTPLDPARAREVIAKVRRAGASRVGKGGKTQINTEGSRAVEKISWDDDAKELIVTFNGGRTYTYKDVDDNWVRELESNPDFLGRILNDIKKQGFQYERGGKHAPDKTLRSRDQRRRESLGMRSARRQTREDALEVGERFIPGELIRRNEDEDKRTIARPAAGGGGAEPPDDPDDDDENESYRRRRESFGLRSTRSSRFRGRQVVIDEMVAAVDDVSDSLVQNYLEDSDSWGKGDTRIIEEGPRGNVVELTTAEITFRDGNYNKNEKRVIEAIREFPQSFYVALDRDGGKPSINLDTDKLDELSELDMSELALMLGVDDTGLPRRWNSTRSFTGPGAGGQASSRREDLPMDVKRLIGMNFEEMSDEELDDIIDEGSRAGIGGNPDTRFEGAVAERNKRQGIKPFNPRDLPGILNKPSFPKSLRSGVVPNDDTYLLDADGLPNYSALMDMEANGDIDLETVARIQLSRSGFTSPNEDLVRARIKTLLPGREIFRGKRAARTGSEPLSPSELQEIANAPLYELARIIRADVNAIPLRGDENFGSIYLNPLHSMVSLDDSTGGWNAATVTAGVLENLKGYNTPRGKAVKAELRKRLQDFAKQAKPQTPVTRSSRIVPDISSDNWDNWTDSILPNITDSSEIRDLLSTRDMGVGAYVRIGNDIVTPRDLKEILGIPSTRSASPYGGPVVSGVSLPTWDDLNTMRRIPGRTGLNEGYWFEDDSTGRIFFAKRGRSDGHAEAEVAGAAVYRVAGAGVPHKAIIKDKKGETWVVSEKVDNLQDTSNPSGRVRAQAKQDMGIDMLLQVRDGWSGGSNKMVDPIGVIYTVDTGGAGPYRAQGGDKKPEFSPDAPWRDVATMIYMPSAPISGQHISNLYGRVSNNDLVVAMRRVEHLNVQKIDQEMADAGVPPQMRKLFVDTITARQKMAKDLADEFEGYEPNARVNVVGSKGQEKVLPGGEKVAGKASGGLIPSIFRFRSTSDNFRKDIHGPSTRSVIMNPVSRKNSSAPRYSDTVDGRVVMRGKDSAGGFDAEIVLTPEGDYVITGRERNSRGGWDLIGFGQPLDDDDTISFNDLGGRYSSIDDAEAAIRDYVDGPEEMDYDEAVEYLTSAEPGRELLSTTRMMSDRNNGIKSSRSASLAQRDGQLRLARPADGFHYADFERMSDHQLLEEYFNGLSKRWEELSTSDGPSNNLEFQHLVAALRDRNMFGAVKQLLDKYDMEYQASIRSGVPMRLPDSEFGPDGSYNYPGKRPSLASLRSARSDVDDIDENYHTLEMSMTLSELGAVSDDIMALDTVMFKVNEDGSIQWGEDTEGMVNLLDAVENAIGGVDSIVINRRDAEEALFTLRIIQNMLDEGAIDKKYAKPTQNLMQLLDRATSDRTFVSQRLAERGNMFDVQPESRPGFIEKFKNIVTRARAKGLLRSKNSSSYLNYEDEDRLTRLKKWQRPEPRIIDAYKESRDYEDNFSRWARLTRLNPAYAKEQGIEKGVSPSRASYESSPQFLDDIRNWDAIQIMRMESWAGMNGEDDGRGNLSLRSATANLASTRSIRSKRDVIDKKDRIPHLRRRDYPEGSVIEGFLFSKESNDYYQGWLNDLKYIPGFAEEQGIDLSLGEPSFQDYASSPSFIDDVRDWDFAQIRRADRESLPEFTTGDSNAPLPSTRSEKRSYETSAAFERGYNQFAMNANDMNFANEQGVSLRRMPTRNDYRYSKAFDADAQMFAGGFEHGDGFGASMQKSTRSSKLVKFNRPGPGNTTPRFSDATRGEVVGRGRSNDGNARFEIIRAEDGSYFVDGQERTPDGKWKNIFELDSDSEQIAGGLDREFPSIEDAQEAIDFYMTGPDDLDEADMRMLASTRSSKVVQFNRPGPDNTAPRFSDTARGEVVLRGRSNDGNGRFEIIRDEDGSYYVVGQERTADGKWKNIFELDSFDEQLAGGLDKEFDNIEDAQEAIDFYMTGPDELDEAEMRMLASTRSSLGRSPSPEEMMQLRKRLQRANAEIKRRRLMSDEMLTNENASVRVAGRRVAALRRDRTGGRRVGNAGPSTRSVSERQRIASIESGSSLRSRGGTAIDGLKSPGSRRIDEQDGQLWESLTPEQRQLAEARAVEMEDRLIRDMSGGGTLYETFDSNGTLLDMFVFESSRGGKFVPIEGAAGANEFVGLYGDIPDFNLWGTTAQKTVTAKGKRQAKKFESLSNVPLLTGQKDPITGQWRLALNEDGLLRIDATHRKIRELFLKKRDAIEANDKLSPGLKKTQLKEINDKIKTLDDRVSALKVLASARIRSKDGRNEEGGSAIAFVPEQLPSSMRNELLGTPKLLTGVAAAKNEVFEKWASTQKGKNNKKIRRNSKEYKELKAKFDAGELPEVFEWYHKQKTSTFGKERVNLPEPEVFGWRWSDAEGVLDANGNRNPNVDAIIGDKPIVGDDVNLDFDHSSKLYGQDVVGISDESASNARGESFWSKLSLAKFIRPDAAGWVARHNERLNKKREAQSRIRRLTTGQGGFGGRAEESDKTRKEVKLLKRIKAARLKALGDAPRDTATILKAHAAKKQANPVFSVGDDGKPVLNPGTLDKFRKLEIITKAPKTGDSSKEDKKDAKERARIEKELKASNLKADRVLGAVWGLNEMNERPTVVTEEEFLELAKDPANTVIRRGTGGLGYAEWYLDHVDRHTTGDGGIAQGPGEYWSVRFEGGQAKPDSSWRGYVSADYQKGRPGETPGHGGIMAIMPADAKIISLDRLTGVRNDMRFAGGGIATALKDPSLPKEWESKRTGDAAAQLTDLIQARLHDAIPEGDARWEQEGPQVILQLVNALRNASTPEERGAALDALRYLIEGTQGTLTNYLAPILGYDAIRAGSGVMLVMNRGKLLTFGGLGGLTVTDAVEGAIKTGGRIDPSLMDQIRKGKRVD